MSIVLERAQTLRPLDDSKSTAVEARTKAAARAALYAGLLPWARWAWVVISLITVGIFIMSVPARYTQLVAPAPHVRAGLEQLRLSSGTYAGYLLTLEIIFAAVFAIVALIIFIRKPNDLMALFISMMLVLVGHAGYPITPVMSALPDAQPGWLIPVRVLSYMTWVSVFLFFCIFPDGRFVPRRSWLLAAFAAVVSIPWNLFPDTSFSPWQWPTPAFVALELGLWGSCIGIQIYRYLRVSNHEQKLKTKWIVFGVTTSVLGALAFFLPRWLDPSLAKLDWSNGMAYLLFSATAVMGTALLTPISIGISILKYKLWDINVLISKTLVYVPLTGIVAGLYAASVSLFQRMFVAITGEQSDAAIVMSTLVLASTFTPIKNGMQAIVDKRFKDQAPRERLNEFGDRVRAVLEVQDARHVAHRLLEEAATAFGCIDGAIYLDNDGLVGPAYTVGDWEESNERVRVPVEHEGVRLGYMALGARHDGQEFTEYDVESLTQTASVVALAIELAESHR